MQHQVVLTGLRFSPIGEGPRQRAKGSGRVKKYVSLILAILANLLNTHNCVQRFQLDQPTFSNSVRLIIGVGLFQH